MERRDYWLPALGVVIADQLSKYFVSSWDSAQLIWEVYIGRVVNPDGLFGWQVTNEWLIAIQAAVSALLIVWLVRRPKSPQAELGAWLLLAGCVSNLIDRIVVGGVVDILGIREIIQFNLADVTILTGAVLCLFAGKPRD